MIYFLSSNVPLTKTYTRLPDGSIEKSAYPNVWEVTSHAKNIKTLSEFEAAIKEHSELGHCLIKGELLRDLKSESRAGCTDSNAQTSWICLDLDGVEADSVEEVLRALGLSTISYVLQWSGSQNVVGSGLRCHIFMLLTRPVSAPLIKQWLIQKNHEVHLLKSHQALTKTGNSLLWGLDISACQSDKLIYIAPPVLRNIKNPLGKMPRISLVKKAEDKFEFPERVNSIARNRELTDARVAELREQAGLPKRKMTYRHAGGHEILVKPDACVATEIKRDRGFVYFNLNGGDSWAYYHPENNPKHIFNFKGEPVYLTSELLPSYWAELKQTAYRTDSTGVTYLALLDRQTSTYWRGTYSEKDDHLQLNQAKTESMVHSFAEENGVPLGTYIPEWDMVFEPQSNVRVDFTNKKINTFERTKYMRTAPKKIAKCPKTIFKIISNVLADDLDCVEHFMNWLAFIAQRRERTMTAWVFQGVPGTGKGVLMNKILAPLFGETQTVIKRSAELSEKWTDFVVGKFIVFIDEVQTSAFRDEQSIIATVKNLITEPTVMVRMMHRNSFPVANYASYIFASNKPDAITIDRNDRRFNVGPYQSQSLVISDAEIAGIEAELQEFYWYLLSYPMDETLARKALNNSSKQNLIQLSQTTAESTATAFQEGDFDFFLDALPTGDEYKRDSLVILKVNAFRKVLHDLMTRTKPDGSCAIKRDELLVIFDYTVGGMSSSPTTFTRYLGHRQLQIKPISINGKVERGMSVMWKNHERFKDVIKEKFNDLALQKG